MSGAPKAGGRAGTMRSTVGDQRPTVRVAIYGRYSSPHQSPDSADDQIRRSRDYVAERRIHSRLFPDADLMIVDEWVVKDEAISGQIASRAGYVRILQGVAEHAFDILIVDDISRLARELGTTLDLYELVTFEGVECISICDAISSADENSRQAFIFKGVISDAANAAHAQRTISRMEVRFRDGYSLGRLTYGYTSESERSHILKGYEKPTHFRIMIHPERAKVVLQIYEWTVAGHGQKKIADLLNERKIPSPGRTHIVDGPVGKWTKNHIKNILGRERYIGKWTWRDTSRIKNPHTGRRQARSNRPDLVVHMLPKFADKLRIVPQALWDQWAAIRDRRRESQREVENPAVARFGNRLGKTGPDHLVSGIFDCFVCGGNLCLEAGTRGGYYACYQAYRKHECTMRSMIMKSTLERALVETLRYLLRKPEWLNLLANKINGWLAESRSDAPQSVERLRVEIGKLGAELRRLGNAVAASDDSDTLVALIREKEGRRRQLEGELQRILRIQSQNVRVTAWALQPKIDHFLQTLQQDPIAAAPMLKALFPTGIPLEAPEKRQGTWRAHLRIDGTKILHFQKQKIAVGAGFPADLPDPDPSDDAGGGGDQGPSRQRMGLVPQARRSDDAPGPTKCSAIRPWGTPQTNSPNTRRREPDRLRFQQGTYLPPADALLVEVLIHRHKTEVRCVDQGGGCQPHVIQSELLRFTGPLADLKRLAHENSRPGLRFYVRERRTKNSASIRVEVRVGRKRTARSFDTDNEARRFIEWRARVDCRSK